MVRHPRRSLAILKMFPALHSPGNDMVYRLRAANKSDEAVIWKATIETVWVDVPEDEKASIDRKTFETNFREYAREFVEGRRGERFVAEDDEGRFLGYMILGELKPYFSPRPVGFVYDIWVSPPHRHREVGSFLLAEAERWARARGYRKIKLEVANANAAALALYRREGFGSERLYLAKRLASETSDARS